MDTIPAYVDWRAFTRNAANPLSGLADYKVRPKLPPRNEHLPPAAPGPEVLYRHRQEHEGHQQGGPSWIPQAQRDTAEVSRLTTDAAPTRGEDLLGKGYFSPALNPGPDGRSSLGQKLHHHDLPTEGLKAQQPPIVRL